jgi:CPA2 family monovalent cation:H+ antiporter-2
LRETGKGTQRVPHDTPLIATIAMGLGLAFIFGLGAHRLRLPPIVGYLAAGIVVGPFTPGYVADPKIATELAEMGVILLMFGVGLHFSLKDLLSVRAIAIPGAVGQIAFATLLGMGLGWALGWSWGAGFVFGLALSVASTVVLLRALQERRIVETERGRIAVGWLIVEDLVMVLALVLLPPLAGLLGGTSSGGADAPPAFLAELGLDLGPVGTTLLVTAAKVAFFVAFMLVIGRRIVPWILHYVAHTGSRELFRLSVLAIALGVAFGAAQLFGVSFALGAFFAGMVLAESALSTQAAKETLPLRDAFAVLFFVSVGMLFDPGALLRQPLPVLATFLIIVVGKSLAAYLIVRVFRHPRGVALTIAASLAQIGEFSFILAVLGVDLAILPPAARDLIVAGAILSILVNPLCFRLLERLIGEPAAAPATPAAPPPAAAEKPLAVLVGHGRVGSRVSPHLIAAGFPLVVVDDAEETLAGLSEQGVMARRGPLAAIEGLDLAKIGWLVVAIPDPFEAGSIVETVRGANPSARIVARAHTEEAVAHLKRLGADSVLMGEEEIARGMVRTVLGAA